jgi:hypothetical protein
MDTPFWFFPCAGIVVLLSWIGFGGALHRLLKLDRRLRPDWSIFAVLGMSLILACGGVTNALHITSAALLNTLTAAGVLLSLLAFIRRPQIRLRRSLLWLLPLIAVGVVLILSSAASPRLNPGDDQMAYLVFPKQMLQTGTLVAPFNLRRMGTYGGQQFLQAQILAATEALAGPQAASYFATHGNLLDSGLGALLCAGLLWRLLRPRSPRQKALGLLIVLLFFAMPIPRVNTHSELSGAALFLAFFVVRPAQRPPHRGSLRLGILGGLIAAALATLRMNFVPAAGLALLLCALPFHRFRTLRSARGWALVLLPLAVMFIVLIPWGVVLLQSSGTPVYPLFKGFQHGAFLDSPITGHPLDHLNWTLLTVLFPPILFLLLPLCIKPPLRVLRGITPLYIAAVLTTLATAWAYTQVDSTTLYRYSSPLLIAAAFATFALVLRRSSRLSPKIRGAVIALLLFAPFIAAHEYSELFRSLLFRRIYDTNALFYDAIAVAGLFWAACSTRRNSLRHLLAVAALLLTLVSMVVAVHALGTGMVFSTVAIVISICMLVWRARRKNSRPVVFLMGFLVLFSLLLIVIDLPFLVDTFAPLCLTVSIAALALLAGRTHFPALRVAAIAAITFLAGFAVPSMNALSLFPFAGLPTAAAIAQDNQQNQLYRDAQNTVPAGAAIFALVAEPERLDFQRNPIDESDFELAFISPPPGLPLHGTSADLRGYLKTLHIRYVLLSSDSLNIKGTPVPPEFVTALADLAHARPLFHVPSLTMIDLQN